MPFIKVKLIDGAFNHAQKQQIHARLVAAMASLDGSKPRTATWVVIEEVKLSEPDNGARALSPVDLRAQSMAVAALTA